MTSRVGKRAGAAAGGASLAGRPAAARARGASTPLSNTGVNTAFRIVKDQGMLVDGADRAVARDVRSGRFCERPLSEDAEARADVVRLAEAMDVVLPVVVAFVDIGAGGAEVARVMVETFRGLMAARFAITHAAAAGGVTLPMSDEVREFFAEFAVISQAKAREELALVARKNRKLKREAA